MIPGCLMVRNRTATFNVAWLGDCGQAPALASTLPVDGICAPASKDAPSPSPEAPKCVTAKSIASGFSVQLPTAATCGDRSGRNVLYRGARCGPRGRFVQWSRVTLAGEDGQEGAACTRVAAPGAKKAGAAGATDVLGDAELVGACGVPPIIHKELPVEICERGTVPSLNLPKPNTPIATGERL